MFQTAKKELNLDFKVVTKWHVIILVTFVTVLVTLGIYYLHPENVGWYKSEVYSLINLLQFVIIDQFCIELLTTTILAVLIYVYAKMIGLKKLVFSTHGVLSLLFKLSPVFLLGYLFFAPVTITIRYIYHHLILGREDLDYFQSYFFLQPKLYLVYLLPSLLICSMLLLIVVAKSTHLSHKQTEENENEKIMLKVSTAVGRKWIHSKAISYIIRNNRVNNIHTYIGNIYRSDSSLVELKEKLGRDFVFLNRAILVNINSIEDYSFWEKEKYIVRLKSGEEFKSTRQRIKKIRKAMSAGQSD